MNLHDIRGERAAENQSAFRSINERITDLNANSGHSSQTVGWICECVRFDCTQTVRMTLSEYEAVRADPTHFLVAPTDEHVVFEVEKVVARSDRYWVVEKLGAAAERAEELSTT